MKILYISSAQTLGGGERHLADLANGMAKRGHDVFATLRPSSPLLDELRDIPKANVNVMRLRNALDAKSARGLAKFVGTNKIQIVHAHMARDYPLAAYATRKTHEAILIVTRHVLFALNPLHRITLSRASRVIAVSQAVASQLTSSNLVMPAKLTVVYNGIDSARFAAARTEFDRRRFLRDWKLPEECVLIGIVGELKALKGQAEFLQAAGQITQRYPNAYFIIAGTDHSKEKENSAVIDSLISSLRLTQRVRRVQWLEDIAQLYCALDVFVSASHSESFGLAIAEAMACATPVVSTATGGAREIIKPGETGLLVPVNDVDQLASAVLALLGNQGQRMALGQAAQQSIAAKFGIARMLDETERIYREEIGG